MRLWIAIALAVVGCKKRDVPLVLAVDPVSEADANAFVQKLLAVIKPCDDVQMRPLVDQEAMAAKFATTSKLPNVNRSARTLAQSDMGAKMFCQFARPASEYKLLRVKMVGSEPHPIMRRMMKDPKTGATAIGYDELQLGTTRRDHQVRMYDAFFYVQGQWMTQLLGGNLQAFSSSLDTLGEIPRMGESVGQARELQRKGRFYEAMQIIDKLPPDVRGNRGVQMIRIHSAAGLGPDSFKQALEELERVSPNDPSIAMVEIDGAFALGNFDAALKWIDVIDKAVGGDPFQETNRAFAYLKKNELDKAAEHAQDALKQEPTLKRAWEIQLDVAIARKQWADAIAALTELETKFGVKFDLEKLRAHPPMAEFVTTPEFQNWLATHK